MYCLKGDLDALELPFDVYFGAIVGRIDVDAIVDRQGPLHKSFSEAVIEDVLKWRETTSQFCKELLAFGSLLESNLLLNTELIWSIAGPLAESYLFQRGWPYQKNIRGEEIIPKQYNLNLNRIQALRDKRNIVQIIERDPVLLRYMKLLNEQHQRNIQTLRGCDFAVFSRIVRHLFEEPVRDEPLIPPKKVKRALTRSVKALNALVDQNAYKSFVSKSGFTISGYRFNYNVRKTQNLIEHTADPTSIHIPYNLTILSKTGQKLSTGCIIFEDTPVLDQIIALTLHVKEKESEMEILDKGNWTETYGYRYKSGDFVEVEKFTKEEVDFMLALPETRFAKRRLKIMRLIEKNVHDVIAELAGIPNAVYNFMIQPKMLFDELAQYDKINERVKQEIFTPLFSAS